MATNNQPVNTEYCPECNHPTTPTSEACPNCNLVLNDSPLDTTRIPHYMEDKDTDRSVVLSRTNHNQHDKGLGSHIMPRTDQHVDCESLVREQHFTRNTPSARTIAYGTSEIHRISIRIGLPECTREQAKTLFRKYHSAGGTVGNDLDTASATCVYTASRVRQHGHTPSEIAEYARCEQKAINRCHKRLTNTLSLNVPPPDPTIRLRRVANSLGLREPLIQHLQTQLQNLPDSVVYSGSPSTLAARLIYDETNHTQREVADAADVSPWAIRNRTIEINSLAQ